MPQGYVGRGKADIAWTGREAGPESEQLVRREKGRQNSTGARGSHNMDGEGDKAGK